MDVRPAQGVVAREVLLKFKRCLALIILFFFSTTVMKAQSDIDELLLKYNKANIPYISAEELRMLQIDEKVMILDARELEEFKVSHLENSIWVGYDDFNMKRLKDFNRNQPVVVYCSLGIRSENIAEKLEKEGFSNIRNLYGGIFQWKDKDFPVIDSTGNSTERVHAYSKRWSQYLNNAEKIY